MNQVKMNYFNARQREMQTTLKVLQAYPEGKMNMKPAEKSRTAGELAMTLVFCILNSFTNASNDRILEVECHFPLQPDLPPVRQSENS